MYDIQRCFICRHYDSTVSEDAGIKPRTVATTALAAYLLAVRPSKHSARSHDCSYFSMKEVVFLMGFATGFDCAPLIEPNKSYKLLSSISV